VWGRIVSRLLNAFKACPETRWCIRCNERVPCQLGYDHDAPYHLHLPDPWARNGHDLKWRA
jgi:hypothetical protein